VEELSGPREKETKMNKQLVRICKEAKVLPRIHLGKLNTEKNSVRILRSPVEFVTGLLLEYSTVQYSTVK